MLSWEFPPRSTGGIAAHVAGLGTALARAGHDVVVLTIADRPAELDARPPDQVRVLRTLVDLPWLPPSEEVTRIASANHAITKLGSRFVGELDGWRPDIVHGHDWQLGWASESAATTFRSCSPCTAPNGCATAANCRSVIRPTSTRSNGGSPSRRIG